MHKMNSDPQNHCKTYGIFDTSTVPTPTVPYPEKGMNVIWGTIPVYIEFGTDTGQSISVELRDTT